MAERRTHQFSRISVDFACLATKVWTHWGWMEEVSHPVRAPQQKSLKILNVNQWSYSPTREGFRPIRWVDSVVVAAACLKVKETTGLLMMMRQIEVDSV